MTTVDCANLDASFMNAPTINSTVFLVGYDYFEKTIPVDWENPPEAWRTKIGFELEYSGCSYELKTEV